MSLVSSVIYYKCDYCGNKITTKKGAYTDSSGLDNKDYDMCSNECLKKHKEYLKSKGINYNKHKKFITEFFI